MLEKKIILAVAGMVAAGVVYLGYAIYKDYPEKNTNASQEGVGA